MQLTIQEICIRLVMAILFSGAIGWEREFNSRPAGLRTHILVCVGAALIAMMQTQITMVAMEYGANNPEMEALVRSDPARLIAQVVSGIGFLGAGTIVVTKSSIRGLTTAASLWTTAGLGLAIGMGYYHIAVATAVVVLVVLILVKKTVHLPRMKKIEIEYNHRRETKEYVQKYFAEREIKVRDINFSIRVTDGKRTYIDQYTIELPKGLTYVDIAEDLSGQENITEIRQMNL